MRKVKAEFTMALEAEKADFIEAQKSLADLGASQTVNKSSCAPVASVHEASVKGFSEGLKALAEAMQRLVQCSFSSPRAFRRS